jgi:NADPH:quinone reductase
MFTTERGCHFSFMEVGFPPKAGRNTLTRLRERVADELTTTFATGYTRTIGLAEALEPDVLRA